MGVWGWIVVEFWGWGTRDGGYFGVGGFVGYGLVVSIAVLLLGAGLGGQGEGDLVAVGLSQDDLGLVDGHGAVLELDQVDALLDVDILADDLGQLDGLGDALLDGLGRGHLHLHTASGSVTRGTR